MSAATLSDEEIDNRLRRQFGNYDTIPEKLKEAFRKLERDRIEAAANPVTFFNLESEPAVGGMQLLGASLDLDDLCTPIEGPMNYWQWIAFFNVQDNDYGSDTYGDGISNLMKYYLGLDPHVDGRRCLPRALLKEHGEVDYLAVSFLRPRWVEGVRVLLEASADLVHWSWVCDPVVLTEDLPQGYSEEYERVWMLDRVPWPGENRRFLRMRLQPDWDTQAPPSFAWGLVDQLLGEEPGLTVLEVRYLGNIDSSGCFREGIAHGLVGYDEFDQIVWSMDEGVLLTTGRASDWNDPAVDVASISNGRLGDTQLDDWMQPEFDAPLFYGPSTNASVLEIDFIPEHNRIGLRYLFASEEYYKTEAPKNDAMAIFLGRYSDYETKQVDWEISGEPGGNIALLPEPHNPYPVEDDLTESRAVAVFNIGHVFHYNPDALLHYLSQGWFVANFPDPDQPHGIIYSGFTIAFDAIGEVVPHEPHVLRIVIADGSDHQYDAATFLEKGGFHSFHVED